MPILFPATEFLGKFGLFQHFITEELSNEKKINKTNPHLTTLVVWPSGFAMVLWFPKPRQWVLVLICLQQHPLYSTDNGACCGW